MIVYKFSIDINCEYPNSKNIKQNSSVFVKEDYSPEGYLDALNKLKEHIKQRSRFTGVITDYDIALERMI